jgi:hypothetical protein
MNERRSFHWRAGPDRRQCAGCRIAYIPEHVSDDFCAQCRRLGMAGRYLELVAQLYADNRRSRR